MGMEAGFSRWSLKADKTFDLKHIYKALGNYTITVRVEDNDGGVGQRFLIPVKVKQVVTSLEMGEDISINEGDTLKRDVPDLGIPPGRLKKSVWTMATGAEKRRSRGLILISRYKLKRIEYLKWIQ